MSFPLYGSTSEKNIYNFIFPSHETGPECEQQAPRRLADPQLYFIAVRAPPSCQVSDFPFTCLYLQEERC